MQLNVYGGLAQANTGIKKMKLENDYYPLAPWWLRILSIVAVGLAVFFVTLIASGTAATIGKIIGFLTVGVFLGVVSTFIVSTLVKRYKNIKDIFASNEAVLLINRTSCSPEYKFSKSLIPNLCMALRRGCASRGILKRIRLETLEPVTLCYVRDRGDVIVNYGGEKKVLSGFAIGHHVELSWYGDSREDKELFTQLLKHELGHVMLDEAGIRGTDLHHQIMRSQGF